MKVAARDVTVADGIETEMNAIEQM